MWHHLVVIVASYRPGFWGLGLLRSQTIATHWLCYSEQTHLTSASPSQLYSSLWGESEFQLQGVLGGLTETLYMPLECLAVCLVLISGNKRSHCFLDVYYPEG